MDEARDRRRATGVLLAAVALSAFLILYWSRGETFYADDWTYIVARQGWALKTLFFPTVGHLIVLPLVLFKTLLEMFGADSALPFRLAALFFVQLNGVLVYLLARRRVGPWLALVPAVLMLFLGSGWEMIISPFALNALMSIAAGLGMLLFLDRSDRAGDVAAAALLVVSLASFSLGVVFGVIAAWEVLQRPRRGLPTAWVYLVPAVLYGAWLIWASQYDQSQLEATNIGPSPTALVDGAAAVAASIFGVFRSPGPENPAFPDLGIRIDWGIPIALALVAALVLRLRAAPRPTPRAWALIVGLVVLWGLLALSVGPARSLLASRYVYPGVLLVLLLAAELVAGARISRGWRVAVLAALGVSLVANVDTIREGGAYFRAEASYNRAQLAALELERDHLPDEFQVEGPSSELLPHGDMLFLAGDYFEAVDEYGSPAYSQAQLAEAGPEQRAAADELLGRALSLSAVPVSAESIQQLRLLQPGIEPGSEADFDEDLLLRADKTSAMTARPSGTCLSLRPEQGLEGRAILPLPRGGFYYRAPDGAEVKVELGRFGDGFTVKPDPVFGSAVVQIPPDESTRPWRALIRSSESLLACPA